MGKTRQKLGNVQWPKYSCPNPERDPRLLLFRLRCLCLFMGLRQNFRLLEWRIFYQFTNSRSFQRWLRRCVESSFPRKGFHVMSNWWDLQAWIKWELWGKCCRTFLWLQNYHQPLLWVYSWTWSSWWRWIWWKWTLWGNPWLLRQSDTLRWRWSYCFWWSCISSCWLCVRIYGRIWWTKSRRDVRVKPATICANKWCRWITRWISLTTRLGTASVR